MTDLLLFFGRPAFAGRLTLLLFSSFFLPKPEQVLAHPMPNSIVLLDINQKNVAAELQLPLGELQLAINYDLSVKPEAAIIRLKHELITYITQHVQPVSKDGKRWQVSVVSLSVNAAEQTATGRYQELIAQLVLTPPAGATTRNFVLNYDVIVHQVVTHKALVRIRQDWELGLNGEQTTDVGLIEMNAVSNTVKPLVINQEPGSNWQGFKSMLALGMNHIVGGVIYLLFLLMLLLPAPLLITVKGWGPHGVPTGWGPFGGTRYSIIRLLKIITAFTIGHSITLITGSLGWLHFPTQPTEILIAISILIAAFHAVYPLFPGKEAIVAALFGLIHGMAFAGTLAHLNLETGRMALSILGFNIGIELMQLFVILLIVPSLVLLSKTSLYVYIRIGGAVLAGVAAVGWMAERILQKSNFVTGVLQHVTAFAPYLAAWFAVVAISSLFIKKAG